MLAVCVALVALGGTAMTAPQAKEIAVKRIALTLVDERVVTTAVDEEPHACAHRAKGARDHQDVRVVTRGGSVTTRTLGPGATAFDRADSRARSSESTLRRCSYSASIRVCAVDDADAPLQGRAATAAQPTKNTRAVITSAYRRTTWSVIECLVLSLVVALVILVLVLTVLIVLQQVGVEITPLIAGLGVAGLGISFALQGVLSNVMAGLTIIFTKPYRVGEYIRIVGEEGYVEKIDIFTTTLTHIDRSRVVIPNRKIVGEILHNYGMIRQLKITMTVTDTADVAAALKTVQDVLGRNPRVLKDPAPASRIMAFADSGVALELRFWIKDPEEGVNNVRSDLHLAVWDLFKEAGITIPYPQRDVHMK